MKIQAPEVEAPFGQMVLKGGRRRRAGRRLWPTKNPRLPWAARGAYLTHSTAENKPRMGHNRSRYAE